MRNKIKKFTKIYGSLFIICCIILLLPSIHDYCVEHYTQILYVSGILIRFALIPAGTISCFLILRRIDPFSGGRGIRLAAILVSLLIFVVFSFSFGIASHEVLPGWGSKIIEMITNNYISESKLATIILILPWAAKFIHSIIFAILVKIARRQQLEESDDGLHAVNIFTTFILIIFFLFMLWSGLLLSDRSELIGLTILFAFLSVLAGLLVNLPYLIFL